jgi:nucleotide-binding universal stress UspA family protein
VIHVKHVLCPIDFSEFSSRALAHAAALARWYEARLTVLYVYANVPAIDVIPSLPQYGSPRVVLSGIDRAALETELRQFCARSTGDAGVTTVVADAPSIEKEILAQIDTLDADLLVIGSHGRSGFDRLLLGSIAEKVLRRAPCLVMVVPAHDTTSPAAVRFKRIVCPVDFSESSRAALHYALSLVEESDGWLSLLNVLEIPPELHAIPTRDGIDVPRIRAEAHASSLSRLRELIPSEARAYCTVGTSVLEGKAHRQILATADDCHADLIVMGVSGHGAVDRWVFGSNTSSVIRGARCPVLTVRSPLRDSAVTRQTVPAFAAK